MVRVVASSGYKDIATARKTYTPTAPDRPSIEAALRDGRAAP
ncbi:hypothetical protein ACFY8P_11515 [Streptomyces sp. NPDC012693]|nr:hypothetical protein [Streptomyces sp. MSC1_001]